MTSGPALWAKPPSSLRVSEVTSLTAFDLGSRPWEAVRVFTTTTKTPQLTARATTTPTATPIKWIPLMYPVPQPATAEVAALSRSSAMSIGVKYTKSIGGDCPWLFSETTFRWNPQPAGRPLTEKVGTSWSFRTANKGPDSDWRT